MIGPKICTVCRRVRASSSPEISHAGVMKGLKHRPAEKMKTPSACSCCMQCTLSGRKVREVCRRRPAQLAQHSSCTLQAARPSKCSVGSHHCILKQHVQATLAGARSLMIPWCFLRYFFFSFFLFSSFLFLRWKNGENEVNICFKMLHDLHQLGCELTMITL